MVGWASFEELRYLNYLFGAILACGDYLDNPKTRPILGARVLFKVSMLASWVTMLLTQNNRHRCTNVQDGLNLHMASELVDKNLQYVETQPRPRGLRILLGKRGK